MNKFYIDIHIHPGMKAYSGSLVNGVPVHSKNSADHSSIWCRDSEWGQSLREKIESILPVAKYRQADFSHSDKGNLRLLVVALTPPEVHFFDINTFLLKFFIPGIDNVACNVVTEFGLHRIEELRSGAYDYFRDCNREYQFYTQLDDVECSNGKKYLIAQRGQSIDKLQSDNPYSIIVMFSIEGAHALLSGSARKNLQEHNWDTLNDLTNPKTIELLRQIKANIDVIKNWGGSGGVHRPLFMTFCHHFWNLMAGHAVSLAGSLQTLLDQRENVNLGITRLGMEVVKELLDDSTGKRILIDVKHMSVTSRMQYYALLKQLVAVGQPVPVIASHCGCNENPMMLNSDDDEVERGGGKTKITANKKYKNKSDQFNNWSINLSDEEIRIIHDSGGLIGLQLDQRIMSGSGVVKTFPRKRDMNSVVYQQAWVRPFYNNVKHVYNVLYGYTGDARKAVSNMCVGSDYDGIINPLDAVCTTDLYYVLESQLIYLIRESINSFPGLTGVMTVEDMVKHILQDNALDFIRKYYV